MFTDSLDIKKLCKRAQYDEAATATVLRVFEQLKDNEDFNGFIEGIIENRNFFTAKKKLPEVAEKTGVNEYEIALTVLTCFIDVIHGQYKAKGISEDIATETLKDILYKIEECRTVYGVSGIFVFDWYGLFFNADIVKLGRLEYECTPGKFEFDGESKTVDGTVISDGEEYIKIHIPADGPLIPEDVESSMHEAYLFFKKNRRSDGKLILRTGTWLLYPPYVELMKEGSNMRRFAEKFAVIKVVEADNFGDAWRVFGTMSKEINTYPTDTSLRRSLLEYIKSGKKFGAAAGVVVRDGK